jgi:thiol:disulfide interchange protein DsbD
MGAALGFALIQPWLLTVFVFGALALGFAGPFLAVAFVPAIAHAIPRPGAWMERFKQLLAFGMYGAAAWLVWVLAQQVDATRLALALTALLIAAFAAWSWGLATASTQPRRAWGIAALFALILSATAIVSLARGNATPPSAINAVEAYSPEKLAGLRAQHKPVLVDFTAAWCITCLLNERIALSQPSVQEALRRANVTFLKADWTNRNADITAALHALGRDGVPVYALYPADGEPILLPQVLTPAIVIDALQHL